MKKKYNCIIFLGSLLSLLITLKLFWNTGVFVDEFNLTADVVCGGDFWLYMDWLRLLLLIMITILSGINLLNDE